MVGPEFEAYVESPARSAAEARRVLTALLSRWVLASSFDPVGEREDMAELGADELLSRLERETDRAHVVYFNREGGGMPRQVILVFTSDGGMIVGVAAASSQGEAKVLEHLVAVVGGRFGYTTLEELPDDTLNWFRDRARQPGSPRVVDGRLL